MLNLLYFMLSNYQLIYYSFFDFKNNIIKECVLKHKPNI